MNSDPTTTVPESETPEPKPNRFWHILPVTTAMLLLVYAIRHPNCWRWVSESGAHCLYVHMLLLGLFTAMIYFGDILFRFRYEDTATRRLAGRVAGSILMLIWDAMVVVDLLF